MDDEINHADEPDFAEILTRLQAETRHSDAVLDQTVDYMIEADLIDEHPDILLEARERLLKEDPRTLYLEFLRDRILALKRADTRQQYKIALQIDNVALAGLGIWQEDLHLSSIEKGVYRITGEVDWSTVERHIKDSVLGDTFIQRVSVPSNEQLWGSTFPLRLSACDASQHRMKLAIPTNRVWASPAIVNNAGGVVKEGVLSTASWKNIAVPKGLREYEDWVILGPADYASMDEGDYEWSAKSAMDVGQFFVEETFIFKRSGVTEPPDIHFRDGRIFPQDKLMNCTLENRHGQLTREAIYRMVTACQTAQQLGIRFCGVAKRVELTIYSTLINWYITYVMNKPKWNPTQQAISDTELMRHLLPTPDFRGSTFDDLYITTPILRRFETTSNLNRRTRQQVQNDLARLGRMHHNRHMTAEDIANQALDLGVVMFFAGHATTNEQFLPRYEFSVSLPEFAARSQSQLADDIIRILSAIRSASFDLDEDHLWGLDEPITTLLPLPLLVAHNISKQVGSELALDYKQRALAEFVRRKRSTEL